MVSLRLHARDSERCKTTMLHPLAPFIMIVRPTPLSSEGRVPVMLNVERNAREADGRSW